MFSRKILLLPNGIRPSSVLRTYKNIKIKDRQRIKNVNIKGNPGSNRMAALSLDGESPDVADVTLDDIEDGEHDMLDAHLFYDEHMK